MEEMIPIAVKKALEKLGIKTEKTWEPVWEMGGFSIPFTVENGMGVYTESSEADNHPILRIVHGDVCKVVFDGVDYICTATVDNGDLWLIGSENYGADGLPFLVQVMLFDGNADITIEAYNSESSHTLDIYRQIEIVHTIDQKYLPSSSGGGLPVVELEKALTNEEAEGALDASDAAKLTEAAEKLMPIVIRFVLNGVVRIAVFNLLSAGSGNAYSFIFEDENMLVEMQLIGISGMWTYRFVVPE